MPGLKPFANNKLLFSRFYNLQ